MKNVFIFNVLIFTHTWIPSLNNVRKQKKSQSKVKNHFRPLTFERFKCTAMKNKIPERPKLLNVRKISGYILKEAAVLLQSKLTLVGAIGSSECLKKKKKQRGTLI